MKMMHLSDLHLGKRLHEFSLHEDQAYILHEILRIAGEEKPDAVLLSGDLYDKPVPPTEAVALLDSFLSSLARLGIQVFMISGNHDSAERLAFGSRLMDESGVHVSSVYHGKIDSFTLQDEYGPVDFFLLPFVKPVHVRRYFPEENIDTYTDALACAIKHMQIDTNRRNVLLTHQFVTGSTRSESEEINVGGSDNVDAIVFEPFDYVALGHLHAPQNVGTERIRYCGTPLKYSFSETKHQKSVTMIELKDKGELALRLIPLVPLHDVIDIRGDYMTLTSRAFYSTIDTGAYIRIILTDEEDVVDAAERLRSIYPNLMKIDYDNTRTRTYSDLSNGAETERTPMELFDDFFQLQNGQAMSENQKTYILHLLDKIMEGEA